MSVPIVTGSLSVQRRTSHTSEQSSISPPYGDDAAPSRDQVSLGPYTAALPSGLHGW